MSATTSVAPRGWLFGPVPDLLLGCGAGYVLLVLFVSSLPVAPAALLGWGAVTTLLTGMPHYGATLLRVYERREDRRRYTFFAVWASLLVWAVFVWGVYDRWVGTLLLSVYLTWSPWHYTGQNYGLAVMFLRRAGVELPTVVKRPLYLGFLLSYGLAFLSLHGGADATGYGPAIIGTAYQFVGLGIPRGVYAVGVPLVFALQIVALCVAGVGLLRRAPARSLVPAAALVATQTLWFTLPSLGLWWTGAALSSRHVLFVFIWVAIGHSVQYLWVTTWYAAGGERGKTRLQYLGKTVLAGAAIWTVPAFLFSPSLLGRTTYGAGLYILVASAVNIQHFVLDGAIWKLRGGPVARILLAPAPAPAPASDDRREIPHGVRRLVRGAVWAVAAASTVIAIGVPLLERLVWYPAARANDAPRAAAVENVLALVGRSEASHWNRAAREHVARGDLGAAERGYQQSIALDSNADAWIGIGDLQLKRGDKLGALSALENSLRLKPNAKTWSDVGLLRELTGDPDGAGAAYEMALRLDSNNLRALTGYGRYALALGDRARATLVLTLAEELAPDDPSVRAALARLREGS